MNLNNSEDSILDESKRIAVINKKFNIVNDSIDDFNVEIYIKNKIVFEELLTSNESRILEFDVTAPKQCEIIYTITHNEPKKIEGQPQMLWN